MANCGCALYPDGGNGCHIVSQLRTDLQNLFQTSLAEVMALKGQCTRWEAMYEGMMAERDGLTDDLAALRTRCEEQDTQIRFLMSAHDDLDKLTDEQAKLLEACRRCKFLLTGDDCSACDNREAR